MKIICELEPTKGEHGSIKITVKDSGCGIKQEDQDKLFKLFGFLENTKEINTKGIGLGLHISKKIVLEFGGEVNVKSTVNVGSEFSFTFLLEECIQE